MNNLKIISDSYVCFHKMISSEGEITYALEYRVYEILDKPPSEAGKKLYLWQLKPNCCKIIDSTENTEKTEKEKSKNSKD